MTKFVISGGTIIDGLGGKPVQSGALLIEDGKIAAVGNANEIASTPDATTIDATGKFVMPGIIDSHVHVTPNQDIPDDPRVHLRVGFNAINTLRQSLDRGVHSLGDGLRRVRVDDDDGAHGSSGRCHDSARLHFAQ